MKMRMFAGCRRVGVACAIAAVGTLGAADLSGQGLAIGLQASSSRDAGWGGGPRAHVDLPFFRVTGSFDLFFPDAGTYERSGVPVMAEDVDYWEANFNALWKVGFGLLPITPYLGGGLNFAGLKVEGASDERLDVDETSTGINVLGGAELDLGSVAPFFDARYTFGGGDQWVLTFGLTF